MNHDWIWWIRVNGLTNETFKKWILPRRHLCLTHKIVFKVKTSQRVLVKWVFLHKLLFLVSLAYRNQRGIFIFSKQREPTLGWGYFSWLGVEEEKSHQDFLLWANHLKKVHKNLMFCPFRYQNGCIANVKKGGNEGHQIQSELRFNFGSQNDLLFNQWWIICLGFWGNFGKQSHQSVELPLQTTACTFFRMRSFKKQSRIFGWFFSGWIFSMTCWNWQKTTFL